MPYRFRQARESASEHNLTKGRNDMKTKPGFEHAERIAFATSEPVGVPAGRWTELGVYYDHRPTNPGKPWIAVVRGCSTYPGETMREEIIQVGTLERALKLFDPNSQLGRSVIAQAEDWQEPAPILPVPDILPDTLARPPHNRFTGTDQDEALRWLYGAELDKLTPAKLLERDFGVVEGTVRAAVKAGREIKIPLAAAMRFFDREAFQRARAVNRG